MLSYLSPVHTDTSFIGIKPLTDGMPMVFNAFCKYIYVSTQFDRGHVGDKFHPVCS